MGPAPAVAEMRTAVRRLLAATVPEGGTVLVACSGGADSLALALATSFVAPRLGLRAGLVTVDHGLQAGSELQAARVADTGRELGLDPVQVVRVQVGDQGGPEAAARIARYAALDSAAAGLDAWLLLGHTLDDQAESVLLGLGRGSGPRSIAGMRPVDGRRLRPLLGVRRSVTETACAAAGLVPWQDPHNSDPRYRRVRLRSEALPLLDDILQGGVDEALARTAALLADDLDALDRWAATALQEAASPVPDTAAEPDTGGPPALAAAPLAALPRAVRTRVLRAWLAGAAAAGSAPEPLSAERTAALDALLTDWHGQGAVDVPGGLAVLRRSGRLVVVRPDRRRSDPAQRQEPT